MKGKKMRARLITILIISIVIVIGFCGCMSSTKIPPKENCQKFEENAVGQWFNVDKATRGTAKLVISRNGEKWLIQGWGTCHPTDCNWGQVPLFIGGEGINDKSFTHGFAIWNFDFKTEYMTLKIKNDSLFTESINIFKDGSGRSNYFPTEEFKQ